VPSMSGYHVRLKLPVLLGLLLLTQMASGQGAGLLLRIQRLHVEMETTSNLMSSGNNAWDAATLGQPQDLQKYPNSSTCLLVYEDGKYFVEKNDERTPGKPKAKSGEGVLTADDLQQLRAILEDEALKKITTPKALDLPADAQFVREAERLDVQIARAETAQQFSVMKARVKTGTSSGVSSASSLSGIDTFLDNGAPYRKTLGPLMKWSEEREKKSKLTQSKPQNCE
jgi:hypothetical protein